MAVPLAPTVNGPIVTSSPSVRVSGALAGATVELLVGGGRVGQAPATANGDLWVSLDRSLNAGETVVARQTLAGVTGPASNDAVPVLPVPSPLPTPVFASPMSQFMSHVLLGGLVPGATVTVGNGTATIGIETPSGASMWVKVDPTQLAAGQVLNAVQKIGATASATAFSNKLVAVNARVVPAPRIEEPVRACETVLHILEAIPAADLVAENGPNSNLWHNIADAYWGTGAVPFVAGPLKVRQLLPGAGTQSPDTLIQVQEPTQPPIPTMNPFCPESRKITVSNLKPGGVLTVWKKVNGEAAETELGSIGIGAATMPVDLPEVVGGSGPIMAIVVRQTLCNLTSAPGGAIEFSRPGSGAVPPGTPKIVAPLFDCARGVRCESLALVATRLFSVRFNLPLSGWAVPPAPGALLSTWFPLVAGDVVRIEQSGCGAPSPSAEEPVQPLPSPLPSPKIEGPVRPGATAVTARGFLPGARAHLMVEWMVRASVDAWGKEVTFHLPTGLKERERLWAFQTLCAASSAQEGPPVVVEKGQLSVEVSPASVNGGATTSMTVTARDGAGGPPLNGLVVQIGGANVGFTGTAFNWMPPTSGTSAGGVVLGGSAFQNAAFTIAVRQPVPIALGLYPGEGAVPGQVAMSAIKWTATPQWAGGAEKTLEAATGKVEIEGAPPGGTVRVTVSVDVTLAADGNWGFPQETIPVAVFLANVALVKPTHAVSARVTVTIIEDVNDDGEVAYRRWVQVKLWTVA
jgi:hypothetical protein